MQCFRTPGSTVRLLWAVVLTVGVVLAAPSDPTQAYDGVSPALEEVSPALEEVSPALEEVSPALEEVSPALEEVSLAHDGVSPALEEVSPAQGEMEQHRGVISQSERRDKAFFVLLRIQPDECNSSDPSLTTGTCLPSTDCTRSGGTFSGTCARGFGVCCIGRRSCGESTSYNNTYFVNPSYNGTDIGAGACTLTVFRVDSNICQLRLDFLNFQLAQPDENGNCNVDFLTVTPSTTVPRICGSNDGQHMYLDVDPVGGPVRVTVDRSGTDVTRSWNIKVTQISCSSQHKAPSGCLQYHTATSGTVNSFDFSPLPPTPPAGTSQIADLDYGVCVEMADGYCGIIWERNTTNGNYSFTVSGNANASDESVIGTALGGGSGVDCTTDYVIIPGGVADTGVSNDRYCGLGFPNSVTSTMKPFSLYVHQDGDEVEDSGNSGFSLNYRQITSC
nr:uncharacterized protein LOC123761501 [Procambarus clarkii]